MMKMLRKNSSSVAEDLDVAGFLARGLNMLVRVTLGLFVAGCVIAHPGVQIQIPQKGLEYIGGLAVKGVSELMTGEEIFYSNTFGTDYEHIWASVNCGKIISISMPTYDIKSQPGRGVEVSISNMKAIIAGMLSYNISNRKLQQDPKSMTVVAEDISVDLLLQVVSRKGRPALHIPPCGIRIQKLSLVFGPDSPSNTSLQFLEELVKDDISMSICSVITGKTKKFLTNHLNRFKRLVAVGSKTLDLTMEREVAYEKACIRSFHKGQFVGDEEQLKETNMNTSIENGIIITTISEEVFQSYLRAEHGTGVLSRSLEKTVRHLGMQWKKSGSKFVVTLKMDSPKKLKITSDGIVTKFSGTLESVALKDSNQSSSVSVEVTAKCQVELSEDREFLKIRQINQTVVFQSRNLSEESLVLISEDIEEHLGAFQMQTAPMKLPIIAGLAKKNVTISFEEHFIKIVSSEL